MTNEWEFTLPVSRETDDKYKAYVAITWLDGEVETHRIALWHQPVKDDRFLYLKKYLSYDAPVVDCTVRLEAIRAYCCWIQEEAKDEA